MLLHAGRWDSTHCCMLGGGNCIELHTGDGNCIQLHAGGANGIQLHAKGGSLHAVALGVWISTNCYMLEVSIYTHI